MVAAAQFVETSETRHGYKVACLEEIAMQRGWMSREEASSIGRTLTNNGYGQYLLSITEWRSAIIYENQHCDGK